MAAVRIRQHVNPLSHKYQGAIALPDWSQIYAQPTQPLHLDIGCARGIFLMQMATLQPDWNFLGLEIRAPLVEQAQQEKEAAGLTNLYFLFGNANVGVDALLWSLPTGALQRVSIQFPDPWFKKRHQKRRVVQPELVASLAQALAVGGQVILQSDVAEVAEAMCDRFTAHRDFQRTSPDWLPESPFPAQTDREQLTLSKGLSVYRAIYVRS